MVDRGTCHFVSKVLNIQKYGGILAIIVDNKEFEDPDRLIMSDDGTGKAVKIPSFLIGKSDGDKIKAALE
jgi:hypothetical protein